MGELLPIEQLSNLKLNDEYSEHKINLDITAVEWKRKV